MSTNQTADSLLSTTPQAYGDDSPWVVLIDHHQARIFRSSHRGTKAFSVRPQQTDESISHSRSFSAFARGKEKPLFERYFAPVCKALRPSRLFLICGGGTGAASMMRQFESWVRVHQPELARRMIGPLAIDAKHLTDAQLLSLSRNYWQPLLRSP